MDRVLGSAAVVGGSIWIGLRFFNPDWGPPGTSAYLAYEFWSRIWALALVLMAVGFIGLHRGPRHAGSRAVSVGLSILIIGLVVMAIGNVAEFWVFTGVPYGTGGPNARDVSWMSFLLGTLLALIGATVAGLAMAFGRAEPPWLSAPLAVVLPATVLLGLVDMSWVGVPLGVAAIAAGISRAVVPLRPGTRAPAG